MDAAIEYRSKFPHFRTLIIGRANAGKTTLLKKVCNSIEDPEIFSPSGKKLDPAVVQESSERGIHNIRNELIFKSNPQFIFHDSRGFESGSLDEIETVKSFIDNRAKSRQLSEQLHAIWYCLPTDTNRPLLEADRNFFEKYGGGKVPIIAIFTKFDGLVSTAYGELRDKEGLSINEAKKKKFERAQENLTTNFVEPLQATGLRPSHFVRLDDMRKEDNNCRELIEKTANALDDDRLKLLFVSVQKANIDICIRNALRSTMLQGKKASPRQIISSSLAWFPHVWRGFEYDQSSVLRQSEQRVQSVSVRQLHQQEVRQRKVLQQLYRQCRIFWTNVDLCTSAILVDNLKLSSLDELVKTASGRAELLVLLCICIEQTFAQASATERNFAEGFSIALNAYAKSTVRHEANNAIKALFEGQDSLESEVDGLPVEQHLANIIRNHCLRINTDTP